MAARDVPSEMSANVERGMETARFRLSEKEALVPAADIYVGSLPRRTEPSAIE
jgi:hypothetical protein